MEDEQYYTIAERRKLLKDVFDDDNTQEKFREYRRYVETFLGDDKSDTAAYGFNFCLKMIDEATDIKWEDTKWKGLYSSMVTWFSVLVEGKSKIKE